MAVEMLDEPQQAQSSYWSTTPPSPQPTAPQAASGDSYWSTTPPPSEPASAPSAPDPTQPTVSPYSPSFVERGENFLRNSPIGHAIQTEFPTAPQWMKPTTNDAAPEYKTEQEQFRPEQLVEGVTQGQAEGALGRAAAGAVSLAVGNVPGAVTAAAAPNRLPLPKGILRDTPASAPTPRESLAAGAAKRVGDATSAPAVAQLAGIGAATGGVGDLLGPALEGLGLTAEGAELGTKIGHALVGAGFTVQMSIALAKQVPAYRKALNDGDRRKANEILGGMLVDGTLAAMSGAHTAAGVHGIVKDMREPPPPATPDEIHAQAVEASRAKPEAASTTSTGSADTSRTFTGAAATARRGDGAEGRPVVQASGDPAAIRASAAAQEPALRQMAEQTVAGIPGAKVEGSRVKDAESQENKAERGKPAETNIDHLGARVSAETPEALAAVKAAIRNELPVAGEEKIDSNGLNADQFSVRTGRPGEANQVSELQVVNKPQADAMKQTDGLYDQQKQALAAGDKAEAARLGGQIAAQHEAAQREFDEAPPQRIKPGMQVTVRGHKGVPDGTPGLVRYWNYFPDDEGKPYDRGRVSVTLPDGKTKDLNSVRRENVQPIRDGAAAPTQGRSFGTPSDGRPKWTVAPLELGKSKTGTPREAAISARAAEEGPALVKRYLRDNTQDGRVYLGTDQAKKLFPEYVANPTGLNEDVSQAAAAVSMAARKTALAEPPAPGKDWAKITVGAPATGKTSSIDGGDTPQVGIAMESIPQDLGHLDGLVEQVLASGRKAQVDFAFTDDVRKNVQRMIERAKRTGRVVPIDYLAKAWVRVPKAVAAFEAKFGDEVPVELYDNSGAKGEERLYTGNAQSVVDRYGTTEAAAQEAAHGELERLYRSGAVPEDIYRQALSVPGGGSAVDGGGQSAGSEGVGERVGKPASQRAGGQGPELISGLVGEMNVADLKVDPHRFQYKLNTDASGSTNKLKDVPWSDELAGIVTVWRDPADGEVYVVNGHHRFDLARRHGVRHLAVRMLLDTVRTAEEARVIGAKQNIAEGNGTAVDAAKFIRDTTYTPEELHRYGISPEGSIARGGIALSRLDGRLFDDVVAGRIPERRGIAIGEAARTPEQQEALLKMIGAAERRGRTVTNATIEELGRMVRGAQEYTSTQTGLFGDVQTSKNLALEKAEVSESVRRRIATEKRLFGGLTHEGKARALGEGGNSINTKGNSRVRDRAAQAQELYDKFSTRAGPVDEILNRAAKEIADGGNVQQTKDRAYKAARSALSALVAGAEGQVGEGVRGDEGRPADGAAREPAPAGELGKPSTEDRVRELRDAMKAKGKGVGTASELPEKPTAKELEDAGQGPLFMKGRQPLQSLALPGMDDDIRSQAEAAVEARTAEEKSAVEQSLRSPKADVSRVAGDMERNSPLFFGTDASEQGSLFKSGDDMEAARRLIEGKAAALQRLRSERQQLSADMQNRRVEASHSNYVRLDDMGRTIDTEQKRLNRMRSNLATAESRLEAENRDGVQGSLFATTPEERATHARSVDMNAKRAQAEAGTNPYGQHLELNHDAARLVGVALGLDGPGAWTGVTMDPPLRARVLDQVRAFGKARLAAQDFIGGRNMKDLAAQIERVSTRDGYAVLLHPDISDSGRAEEFAHLWQVRFDLSGPVIDAMMEHPDMQAWYNEVKAGYKSGAYDRLSDYQQVAEVTAKALVADPRVTWSPETRRAVVDAYHKALAANDVAMDKMPATADDAGRTETGNGGKEGKRGDSAPAPGLQVERADRLERPEAGPDRTGDQRGGGKKEGGGLYSRARGGTGEVNPEKDKKESPAAAPSALERQRAARAADGQPDSEKDQRDLLNYATKAGNGLSDDSDYRLPQPEREKVQLPEQPKGSVRPTQADKRPTSLERLRKEMIKTPEAKRTVKEKIVAETKASVDAAAKDSHRVVESVDSLRALAAKGWKLLRNEPKAGTSLMDDYGKYEESEQEDHLAARAFMADFKKRVPDPVRQDAITNWIQASGDIGKLKYWEENSKAPYKKAYKVAQSLTEDEKALAAALKKYYDENDKEDKLAGFYERTKADYMMQRYEKDAHDGIQSLLSSATMQPNPGIFKESTFRNYFEAESAGKRPPNKSAGFLTDEYNRVRGEALRGREFIKQRLNSRAADGRPSAILERDGEIMQLGPENEPYLVENHKHVDDGSDPDRSDYVHIPVSAMKDWFWQVGDLDLEDMRPSEVLRYQDSSKALALRGKVLIHPDDVQFLKNMFERSLVREFAVKGIPLGKAALEVSQAIKDAMFTFAGTHQLVGTTRAANNGIMPINLDAIRKMVRLEGWANPLKLDDGILDINTGPDKEIKRLGLRNGLVLMGAPGEEGWSDGARQGAMRYLGPVGKAMGDYQYYLFHDLIPKYKMALFTKMYKQEAGSWRYRSKLASGDMTPDQLAQNVARQVNSTFGGIDWRRMGISKTVVDLARLGFLAPDFLYSEVSSYAQAFRPGGWQQRKTLMRGAMLMWAAARVLNYLLNDGDTKNDLAHAFSIVVKGKSYSIRTQQGDLLSMATNPRLYLGHRLNPGVDAGMELATGKDDYGRAKSTAGLLADVARKPLPIFLQPFFTNQDIDLQQSFLSAMGVQAGRYYTPAETLAHKMRIGHLPESTEEQSDTSRASRQMVDSLRNGKMTTTDLWNQVSAGKIKAGDASRIQGLSEETQLVEDTKALGLKEALQVYEKASRQERADLEDIVQSKLDKLEPGERPDIEAKAEELSLQAPQ